jgi:hypothetical protein
MTRRAALATAGAITIVLLAAAAAIATNLGMLRVATDAGTAGGLSATELTDNPNGAQAREPEDGAGEDRSGLGASDDHLSPAGKAQDERYEGRNDDD